MILRFNAVVLQNHGMDAAYVEVPYDIKEMFGKGRLLVNATFDGIPYRGQVVKMESPVYMIGITKAIRKQINKTFGDEVAVTLEERISESSSQWKCQRCGRTFKNKKQGHYCTDKPNNIDEYIRRQEPEKQVALNLIRQALCEALPEAEERISWSMPTYWQEHNIIHFAAAKKHIGLYPGPEAVKIFSKELQNYTTSKGTIRIPYEKVDTGLIQKIAKWCHETGHHL